MKPTISRIGIIILVIAYAIIPTDVIPDIIVGIGQVDDLLVLVSGILGWVLTKKQQAALEAK